MKQEHFIKHKERERERKKEVNVGLLIQDIILDTLNNNIKHHC